MSQTVDAGLVMRFLPMQADISRALAGATRKPFFLAMKRELAEWEQTQLAALGGFYGFTASLVQTSEAEPRKGVLFSPKSLAPSKKKKKTHGKTEKTTATSFSSSSAASTAAETSDSSSSAASTVAETSDSSSSVNSTAAETSASSLSATSTAAAASVEPTQKAAESTAISPAKATSAETVIVSVAEKDAKDPAPRTTTKTNAEPVLPWGPYPIFVATKVSLKDRIAARNQDALADTSRLAAAMANLPDAEVEFTFAQLAKVDGSFNMLGFATFMVEPDDADGTHRGSHVQHIDSTSSFASSDSSSSAASSSCAGSASTATDADSFAKAQDAQKKLDIEKMRHTLAVNRWANRCCNLCRSKDDNGFILSLKPCAQCNLVWYCSKMCRHLDWSRPRGHSQWCCNRAAALDPNDPMKPTFAIVDSAPS